MSILGPRGVGERELVEKNIKTILHSIYELLAVEAVMYESGLLEDRGYKVGLCAYNYIRYSQNDKFS